MRVPSSITSPTRHRGRMVAAVSAGALLVAGGATVAAEATTPDTTYYACVRDNQLQAGTIQIGEAPRCSGGATVTQWNAQGPQGLPGVQGETGPQGPEGPAGPQGPAGDLSSAFGVGTHWAASGSRNTESCYLGQIQLTAGVVALGVPANGQLLPINQNQALFSLLGITYGGNGTTNFALPDLRSAAPNGTTYSICTQGIFPSRD